MLTSSTTCGSTPTDNILTCAHKSFRLKLAKVTTTAMRTTKASERRNILQKIKKRSQSYLEAMPSLHLARRRKRR
jgi:hypothetical protein